ncbi:adipocyte plasma membrane-associated protein [Marchantia polymorpha subsp. ruderalis]|uniref:Strictosidine synthase conserved region domain-containing protein n=2 Tax=Marchantia polymorpha TaxID=3197 RepID=A0AAF6BBF7_MARPO|nr:hypothetical protein MARPO_0164s0010 [Marchantia polymorpha]BBN09341.1 hypothetical protein Mp_4g19000 [Marchantia polymorpha subsp. ruderalis]|eukprot:PTQ28414.1 hypothetical protein MARPO_0164s0010 [Marchantia polymorpha]
MASAGLLSPVVAVLILAGAVFLALDPLQLSPIAFEKDFKVLSVPQPTLQLLAQIPRDEKNTLKNAEIVYGGQIFGPESVLFDSQGRGPYTGVGDGRVVRWEGSEKGWVEFATVIANRTEVCNPTTPLAANLKYEHLCGRPLGIRFNKDGDLYICDAYFGLLKVGAEGGLAEVLVSEAEGQKIIFANDLDIDDDGTVYFTDSSSKYPRSKFFHSILEAEETGRFLKYDPKTKETTVLVKKLRFPNGVTFSKDKSFIIIAETRLGRLLRYWVKGPKAGTVEDFVWLPGYPDNVRTNKDGDFWVALHCRRISFDRFMNSYPKVKQALLKLPISMKFLYGMFSGKPHATALKYSPEGKLLQVVEDLKGETVRLISEVEEHDGKLWFGSVLLDHVAVISAP